MADFDFDEARRERPDGFIICGERFGMRDPGYQETARYRDADPPPDRSQAEADEETVAFIEKFIVEADRGRWRALQDRETDALTRGDILGLAVWLMERHADRPTMRPSSSERGPTRISDGSRAAVRLPGAASGS